MVVGELAPKNLAIARPIPLARSLSRSTQIYLAVAGPLIRLFDAASNRLLRAVGIEPVEELSPGATTADLEHVIDESRKGGALDEDLSLLLERGLAYRALSAEQAMTPRVDVDTVPATSTLAAVVDLLRTSPHSRFPVVAQDVDDVVGIVGLAELLEVPRERWGSVTVQDACSAAVVVPGSLPLPAALEQLRASRASWRSSSTSSAGSTGADPGGHRGGGGGRHLRRGRRAGTRAARGTGGHAYPLGPAPPRRGRVVDRHPAAARSGLRHRQRPRAGPARAGGQARRHRHGRRGRRTGDVDDLSVPDQIEIVSTRSSGTSLRW
jgi:CBS domain-containing protein